MFLLISLLLVSQCATPASDSRWDSPDVLIGDSLGPMVVYAADYNYTTGDIYVACAVDSGYCLLANWPGWVFFRSKDHGLTWEKIFSYEFGQIDVESEAIDLVVTKDDTLYAATQTYSENLGTECIDYHKIYEGPSSNWDHYSLETWTTYPPTGKFLSPVLIRDDFEPFHLYRAFIYNIDGDIDLLFVDKSTDKGETWSRIDSRTTLEGFNDCDLTISDSTLYLTYSYTYGNSRRLATGIYKDRGEGDAILRTLHLTLDTINADIEYPRIGATTTTPDNGQLVYTLFSQRNAGTERWDLLYQYSVDGGDNWSTDIDTITQGSNGPVISDIRGYEVAPNEYMDITYCVTSRVEFLFSYDNYWRWSSEGDPTNWHDITDVSGGLFSSVPEIVYSPGASGTEAGVVYNDWNGNLWFDAPWYSGIADNSKEKEEKIRSEVVLPGSVVKLNSRGSTVYDITGREITKLTGDSWDLKDTKGEKVNCGIYVIVNEKTGERVKILLPVK
jgi:hypothetical protein